MDLGIYALGLLLLLELRFLRLSDLGGTRGGGGGGWRFEGF